MRLEKAVRIALSIAGLEGIDGWGLHARSPELEDLGMWLLVGPGRGCTNEKCPHISHDPAAPDLRWVPRVGTLRHLGGEGRSSYYVLRLPGRDLFIRRWARRSYHASLEIVPPEQVPEHILARQAGEQ